MQVVDDVVTKN